MVIERTLSIIKPDATRRNLSGKIKARLEEAGLRVVAQKRLKLTREHAEDFYSVHSERTFFDGLCDFMCSGPILVQVLEGENAVNKNRNNNANANANANNGVNNNNAVEAALNF